MPEPPEFSETIPVPRAVWWWLGALGALIDTALVVAFVAEGRAWAAVAAFVGVPPAVLGLLALVMLPNRAEVRGGELHLRAGLARHRVALAALDPDTFETGIDLARRPELEPRIKTFGSSFPGLLWAGWFRLAQRRKAFVLLNGRRGVTRLEERPGGTLLLLSLRDPQRLRGLLSPSPRALHGPPAPKI